MDKLSSAAYADKRVGTVKNTVVLDVDTVRLVYFSYF